MNMRSYLFLSFVFLTMLALAPSTASAQALPGTGLDLIPSSNYPVPGQKITITAKSYSFQLDSANITWSVNGKTVSKGVGVTNIVVEAPAIGKNLNIIATVYAVEGETLEASLVLSSSAIDLIVETDGFTPSGFPGKNPVAYQNAVKIIAIPHLANPAGGEYDPSSLIYKWQQGTAVIEGSSGYGKQSVTIPSAVIPRPYNVTVTVTSRDGTANGSAVVAINPVNPSLSFYKNDPLYGPLYNLEIGNAVYLGDQRETGIVASPYGFNLPKFGLEGITLSWFINGTLHSELSQNRTVTLRAPAGKSGTSNIDLSISNQTNIMQKITGGFSVVFTGE